MTTKYFKTPQLNAKVSTEILPKRSFKGLKNPILDFTSERAVNLQRVRRIKISSWKLNQFRSHNRRNLKPIREKSSFAKKGQKARLNFPYGFPLDADLFQIRQIFERSHHLQEVRLQCQGLEMNDENLYKFCTGLKRCRSLKSLSLRIENILRITDRGLMHIMKTLKKLVSLRDLSLSLPSCSSCSDMRMYGISKALRRLKFLRNIYVDFRDCQTITDAGIEFLCRCTEKLPFLQKFEINILTCGKVHPSVVRKMKRHKAVEFIYEKVFELASKKEEEEVELEKEERDRA